MLPQGPGLLPLWLMTVRLRVSMSPSQAKANFYFLGRGHRHWQLNTVLQYSALHSTHLQWPVFRPKETCLGNITSNSPLCSHIWHMVFRLFPNPPLLRVQYFE